MFYTALWCNKSEHHFKESIPLEFLSSSIKRHNSKMSLALVILEGYELLSPEYKSDIEKMGFVTIDFSSEFTKIVRRFPNIIRHYSEFERNCFLRWIAFKEIFQAQKTTQFWHIDADVVLYSSLDEIAADTKGKTFILQGSPTLVSISDTTWFDVYESNLKQLDADIIGYSNKAASEKTQCRLRDRNLGNYSVFRNPIGSDQDLIEYLVGSQKLPQDNTKIVFNNSTYYYVQNILEFFDWDEFQGDLKQYPVVLHGKNIVIGNRKIPFIHFTDSFIYYANIFLFFYTLTLHKNIFFRRFLIFHIDETQIRLPAIPRYLYRIARRIGLAITRNNMIHTLTKPEKNDSSKIVLIELINYINKYNPTNN